MINIHASGGREMMEAARDALRAFEKPPMLIAVTVLTSLNANDLGQIGINRTVYEQTATLASIAKSAGLDGVVCSAQEVSQLRKLLGDEFALVTPGIRPQGINVNDQKRVMTPSQAIGAGSDFLVIGRPITQASDPLSVIKSINSQISSAHENT